MDLKKIAEEIRDIVENKKKELNLSFIEDTHTYFMKDETGETSSTWPSVSKLLKLFYEPFPADEIAYKKAKGDRVEMQRLLDEWSAAGSYATNMGSRVHYVLEKRIIEENGDYKDVREPLFEVDLEQEMKSNSMINAGEKFIKLMGDRDAVLLDTEMVLGHPDLGYTGQPDKVWLVMNKEKTGFGMVITDWKTNKPKNFEKNRWTKNMKTPFQDLPDNSLGHYYLQLPFYGKLLMKMLEGTKYEDLKLMGCIVVLVTKESDYKEFRVPKSVVERVMSMDMSKYLDK
tara:strand:+ start:6381 stop:7238 length:858 start_codon:yes stop_codon:yes gene_type:complete